MQVQRAISPKVFISYARQDSSDLAEELVTALEVLKFDGYLDRHDIAAGEDWEHRLDLLIRQADTIVFIISNCSVRSERCAWEVARAIDLAKRIVPVVGMSVDEAAVPPSLQRLNYIHFTVGHSFARSLGQLANAIGLDIDWIREHTRLGELALRWNERRQPDALLLRGEELASGQAWMENWQPELPSPTNIHRQFIAASADAHERRESLERQQNETLARANIDRIDALARREEAVEQMRRRTILAGAVGLTFSFGLGGMAWWTLRASRRAEEAEAQSLDAEIIRQAMRKDITGQIVAYATSPEMYALDGDRGASSPYTDALLSELQMPDVSLWAALSKASAQVVRKTDGGQRPFISSDMNGDLYFLRPSPTRKMRALVIGAGRVDSLNIPSLSGPVGDAAAWHHFLAQSGFEVITLGNPTRADVMGEIERLRIASLGGPNLSIRRVGFVVEEGAGKAREPSLAPPPDTLAVFVFSGYGLRTQFDRFLILADARSTSAESPQNVITSTLLSMAELEQRLREVASASVLIVDTAFTQVDSTTQHGKNALPLK